MKITICTPSYKKPEYVSVLRYVPETLIFVCETEIEDYKKINPEANFKVCKKGIQGNIARIRNHILETGFGEGADAVCMMDDDIQYLGYHQNRKREKMSPDYFKAWLLKNTYMAREWGCYLWGVNLNQDKQSYREYTPFSLTSIILAPFCVHLKSPIRYDERFTLKDDYDFSLQHLNTYRRNLRLNKYFYVSNMAGSGSGQTGGTSTYRNLKRERDQVALLKKKWGESIVKLDSGKSRSHSTKKKVNFDINPIISEPIRGV
jgi:hypothetical protein